MNKAKTGKLLSAAAVANLAVAGFAAAPAGAATHAAGTAGKATATVTGSRGFVPSPKPSARVRPNTETGCNDYICVGLYGGGTHVSYFNAHWYNGGTGCPRAYLGWRYGNSSSFWPFSDVCYKKQVQVNFNETFLVGTDFCARFSGIDNSLSLCEPVR
jgi:hypothetical protein